MARGNKGFCKLCVSKYLPDINRMLDDGLNAREIGDWVAAASAGKLVFARQTLYAHRDNHGGLHKRSVKAPVNRVDPGPRGEDASTGPAPKSSNDDYLEFIRDHSMQELRENPALITPKMGMEAVKILEARKAQNANVIVLARILTNQIAAPAASDEIVVGEYTELETSPAAPLEIGTVEGDEGANQNGATVNSE